MPNARGSGNHRRRLRLAIAGGLLTLLVAPFSYRVESRLETGVHIKGGEAEELSKELVDRFQSPYVDRMILVVQGLPTADVDGRSKALEFMTQSLRSEPGVSGVLSELDFPNRLFDGKNGGTLIILGLQPRAGSLEGLLPGLRARTARLQDQLRSQFPKLKLALTGETALSYDLRTTSSEDVHHGESRALPVTLVLLLLAFGSLVAAMLPLGIGMLAISMTMGAVALLASHFHLSILVQTLATMLGLGLGIDYALLMVSRFREGLAEGLDSGAAADVCWQQAGRTLVISAATVAIGFAALLGVPISEVRAIGVAGLLVAICSVLLCTLILPFVLGLLGTRIDAGSFKRFLRLTWNRRNAPSSSPRWRRWGMAVTSRPWMALLLAGAPLVLLTFQARHISVGLPPGDWLPAGASSVQALHALEHMGLSGIVQPIRIILELPADTPPSSDPGWEALRRVTEHLSHDARTAELISLPTLVGTDGASNDISSLPEWTQKSFLRNDGKATLLEVLPADNVDPAGQVRWVNELRNTDLGSVTGLRGAAWRIGGIGAMDAEYDQIVHERMPRVIGAVVGGSFLALLLGFRSVVVAFKAVLLNLLSVGAAFGALVLVFQEGHGSRIFGVNGGTGSIFPIIPIITFAIVFGLSMDYEVFLVARVLEERRAGRSERAAVAEGLAGTARMITSAAGIMIVVFLAFTLGSFVIIKMLGFTLALAVLIDATLVRMVIGPALLQLAGDWNWWPLGLAGSAATKKEEYSR